MMRNAECKKPSEGQEEPELPHLLSQVLGRKLHLEYTFYCAASIAGVVCTKQSNQHLGWFGQLNITEVGITQAQPQPPPVHPIQRQTKLHSL